MYTWDVLSVNANRMKNYWTIKEDVFESRISAGATEKLPGREQIQAQIVAWSYDMEEHAQNALSDIVNWLQAGRSRIIWRITRSLLTNCREMLVLGTSWKLRQSWSVNKLAWSVTKWIQECVRRLPRLISCINHISEFRQCCHVGNTAQHCRLGLFFAGDFEDLKSTSGGVLCFFGSRTFVRQLDAQGTSFFFAQYYRVWDFLLWMLDHVWMKCFLFIFGHSDSSTIFNQQHCPTQTYQSRKLVRLFIPKQRPQMSKEGSM